MLTQFFVNKVISRLTCFYFVGAEGEERSRSGEGEGGEDRERGQRTCQRHSELKSSASWPFVFAAVIMQVSLHRPPLLFSCSALLCSLSFVWVVEVAQMLVSQSRQTAEPLDASLVFFFFSLRFPRESGG